MRSGPRMHSSCQRRAFRTSSAAASRRSARRMLSAAYGRRSPERWPVASSFRHRLIEFTPILRHQSRCAQKLAQQLMQERVLLHRPALRSRQRRPCGVGSRGTPRLVSPPPPAARTPRRSARTRRGGGVWPAAAADVDPCGPLRLASPPIMLAMSHSLAFSNDPHQARRDPRPAQSPLGIPGRVPGPGSGISVCRTAPGQYIKPT